MLLKESVVFVNLDVTFVSSHFHEFADRGHEMKSVGFSIISDILSNSSLKIASEDSLFDSYELFDSSCLVAFDHPIQMWPRALARLSLPLLKGGRRDNKQEAMHKGICALAIERTVRRKRARARHRRAWGSQRGWRRLAQIRRSRVQ